MTDALVTFLGRLLNRLGHRLSHWGYVLEMRARQKRYRGEMFTYKVTYVDGAGGPAAPAEMPAVNIPAPTGKVRVYRDSSYVGKYEAGTVYEDGGGKGGES